MIKLVCNLWFLIYMRVNLRSDIHAVVTLGTLSDWLLNVTTIPYSHTSITWMVLFKVEYLSWFSIPANFSHYFNILLDSPVSLYAVYHATYVEDNNLPCRGSVWSLIVSVFWCVQVIKGVNFMCDFHCLFKRLLLSHTLLIVPTLDLLASIFPMYFVVCSRCCVFGEGGSVCLTLLS